MDHDLQRRTGAVVAAVALAVAAVLTTSSAAVSKSPHEVDPDSVQPALNPSFAPWSCFEAGQGVTCQGSYDEEYSFPLEGFTCDGRQVWLSGTGHERMTRWHTADGLATRTRVHLDFPADTFSFDPAEEGPELVVSGHWNRHYTYPDPGDPSTRVLTERGLIYRAVSGGRVVLRDVGSVEFAPGADFEEVAVAHGVHEFYDDPAAFDALVCDALT